MDHYIRDFKITEIETFNLDAIIATKAVLEINSHSNNFTLTHKNIKSIYTNFIE